MAFDYSTLPYRRCVGVVLVNAERRVWIGKRIAKWPEDQSQLTWQLPQGGIDEGETPREAAFRELEEETGTAEAELVTETADWLSYDLPDHLLGTALKGRYRGQTQKWFLMRFLGSDADIDISERPGHKAEFCDWRWARMRDVVEQVVPFKQRVYREVEREFSRFLG